LKKPSHTITSKTVRYDVFMKSVAVHEEVR
jgi:hypothetical protein